MPNSSPSNYDLLLARALAARNPSTQPTPSGLSNADTQGMLEYLFPPLALFPNTQDFTKQVLSPVMPAISAVQGAFQNGWDGARAGWDAQSQVQDQYAAQNPMTTSIASVLWPFGAREALESAEQAGGYAARALPTLNKVVADPVNAQTIGNIDQAASGAAKLYDANDWYNLLVAAGHALAPSWISAPASPQPPTSYGILGPVTYALPGTFESGDDNDE